MFYGIISDIHGNLPATNVVLKKLKELRVDEILCLGDIVGYGANPAECIELVKGRCSKVMMGNHDAATVFMAPIDYFNPVARDAVLWTRDRLDENHKRYLAELPYKLEICNSTLVHATPSRPEEWDYLFSIKDARFEFSAFDTQLCFIGHSHYPGIFTISDKGVSYSSDMQIELLSLERYIINVGSVGQPRDGDPRTCFVTWNTDSKEVLFYRIEYNVEAAQKEILKTLIPEELAYRLSFGR